MIRLSAAIVLIASLMWACNSGSHGVMLRWQSSNGATSYEIFRDSGTGMAIIGSASTLNYLDGNVQRGASYSYCVKAVAVNGAESPCSVPVGITIP